MKKFIMMLFGLCLYVISTCSSCRKFVDIEGPATSVSSKNIYNNDATAIGAVTSLYVNLGSASLGGPGELSSLSCIAGLSSDELTLYNSSDDPTLSAYYKNALTNSNNGFPDYWGMVYQRIAVVNAAIEGLNASMNLSPRVKQQLIGEVMFMRAFYNFYLVNLYGDVPLVLSTDYSVNAIISKSSEVEVYRQIIQDLNQAILLLSEKYLKGDGLTAYPSGSEERVRPTKWAAIALLARTYLYMKDWVNAEKQASIILSNTIEYQLQEAGKLEQVFLKNNKEAIWQLQPTKNGYNTMDANMFVLISGGPSGNNPVFLSSNLVNSFEMNDQRKSSWIGTTTADGITYSFANKYKIIPTNINTPVKEYSTVMRLAEQFLIRAEARAHQGNLSGAISDVDHIRERAGLVLIKDINASITQIELINAIMRERRFELFTEWGHRWFDLKRTKKIDEVMSFVTPQKTGGAIWKGYQEYYPISQMELQRNPNLTPTPGY